MSQERLSISRYGTPHDYYKKASDLIQNRNDIVDPEKTLPKLLSDFKRLFDQTQNDKNLHDTVLVVDQQDNKKIYAQRQLLIARSIFFERVFSSSDSQKNNGYETEDVNGVKKIIFNKNFSDNFSAELLYEVVKYIYYGYWEPRSIERTKSTFILAAKLDLKELRNNTANELTNNLNPRNVAEFLLVAEDYEAQLFKKECIKYIIDNRSQIKQEDLERRLLSDKKNRAGLIAEIYKNDVLSKRNNNRLVE